MYALLPTTGQKFRSLASHNVILTGFRLLEFWCVTCIDFKHCCALRRTTCVPYFVNIKNTTLLWVFLHCCYHKQQWMRKNDSSIQVLRINKKIHIYCFMNLSEYLTAESQTFTVLNCFSFFDLSFTFGKPKFVIKDRQRQIYVNLQQN